MTEKLLTGTLSLNTTNQLLTYITAFSAIFLRTETVSIISVVVIHIIAVIVKAASVVTVCITSTGFVAFSTWHATALKAVVKIRLVSTSATKWIYISHFVSPSAAPTAGAPCTPRSFLALSHSTFASLLVRHRWKWSKQQGHNHPHHWRFP